MTEGVAERVDCDGVGPRLLERHPDVERNQWLVLDDEDGMTREVSFHEVFPARLSAIARDRRLLESGDVSQAVDQSSKRNKRDDRRWRPSDSGFGASGHVKHILEGC